MQVSRANGLSDLRLVRQRAGAVQARGLCGAVCPTPAQRSLAPKLKMMMVMMPLILTLIITDPVTPSRRVAGGFPGGVGRLGLWLTLAEAGPRAKPGRRRPQALASIDR